MYAVFNHQIADLPNPQSPYKKDNPKTWGDGVLIDFGDGTLGFAKTVAFDNTVAKRSLHLLDGQNSRYAGKYPTVLNYGGVIHTFSSWDFTLYAYNFLHEDNVLICSLDTTNANGNLQNGGNICLDTVWTNGVPSDSDVVSIWVWVIFTYA